MPASPPDCDKECFAGEADLKCMICTTFFAALHIFEYADFLLVAHLDLSMSTLAAGKKV